jgi:hypothetical protein
VLLLLLLAPLLMTLRSMPTMSGWIRRLLRLGRPALRGESPSGAELLRAAHKVA